MESHALHADGLYYESAEKLWVNIYALSTAQWNSAGVKLDISIDLPMGETATIQITQQHRKQITLPLRRPCWAGNGFSVKINGILFKTSAPAGSYETLRKKALADNPNRFAVMWGPLVLAGDLGPEARSRTSGPDVPVMVAAAQPISNWLKRVAGSPAEKVGSGNSRFCPTRRDAGRARYQPARRRQFSGARGKSEWPVRNQMVLLRLTRRPCASHDADCHV